MNMNKQVTDDLTQDEIDEIISDIEEEFDLYPGNVDTTVTYETTGTIAVELDGDYDPAVLEQTLEEEIAEALDIHVNYVNVEISDDGVITYTITSDSYDDSVALQDLLQTQEVNDEISQAVSDSVDGVNGVTVDPNFNFHTDLYKWKAGIWDWIIPDGYRVPQPFLTKFIITFKCNEVRLSKVNKFNIYKRT